MRIVITALLLTLAPQLVSGQASSSQSSDPRTPRPAHERLVVFEGTWRGSDAQQSGNVVEECSWLEGGRRHMICRNRRDTPAGPIEHRTTYSFRGRDSTYVVTALLATGQVWTYLGRPEGNRWIFNFQPDRPNNSQRLRMVVTVAPDTIHFVEESSENGGPWRTTEDYRHVRVTRVP